MTFISRTNGPDGAVLEQVDLDEATGVLTIVTPAGTTTQQATQELRDEVIRRREAVARRQRLATASATLRQWAVDARATDVGPMTVAQHKAVTQTVVTRLGTFFDRFADLLDER